MISSSPIKFKCYSSSSKPASRLMRSTFLSRPCCSRSSSARRFGENSYHSSLETTGSPVLPGRFQPSRLEAEVGVLGCLPAGEDFEGVPAVLDGVLWELPVGFGKLLPDLVGVPGDFAVVS